MFSLFRKENRPSAADAMERGIVLKNLPVKGLSLPPLDQLEAISANWSAQDRADFDHECRETYATQIEELRRTGLWEKMESEERNFIRTGPYGLWPQAQLDAMWLAESIACLLWALGRANKLPDYDQETGEKIIRGSPDDTDTVKDLVAGAKLRPAKEIDEQRDLAELWHWRCRTHQLIESGHKFAELPPETTIDGIIKMAANQAGQVHDFVPIDDDFPAFAKPFRNATDQEFLLLRSIAQERHKALNWLCGYAPGNRWSETPTDT
jgi:hypothetical protein